MFKVLKGNIQALIKKDKHIVKTIDADLVSLVASFYKLEQPDFTKKNLETFINNLYHVEHKKKYNLVANIKVKNIKAGNHTTIAGYLKCPSRISSNLQLQMVINKLNDVENLKQRKNTIVFSAFHELEHINQLRILKNALDGKNISSFDTFMICECLCDKNFGLNYNHELVEIKANYAALKKFKNVNEQINNKNLISSNEYLATMLNACLNIFKSINLNYLYLKETNNLYNKENVVKMVDYIKSMYYPAMANVMASNNISRAGKQNLNNSLNKHFCADEFENELRKINNYCIDVSKYCNKLFMRKLKRNSKELEDFFIYLNDPKFKQQSDYNKIVIQCVENPICLAENINRYVNAQLLKKSNKKEKGEN